MNAAPDTKPERPSESALTGIASYLCVAVVWLFVITFVFQNFLIPSSSMASTILVGDHVVADREMLAPPTKWAPFLPYREVERGDIVVFKKPFEEHGEHMTLVKRVVGIPGDRIHLRDGIVYRNGVAQSAPHNAPPRTERAYDAYINDFPSIDPGTESGVTAEWSITLPTLIDGADLVVPPGKYFAMGDNRTRSLDSRYWGFVPRENIIGRPLFVYWSIDTPEIGDAEIPLTDQAQSTFHEFTHFFSETRWKRTFHRIQ